METLISVRPAKAGWWSCPELLLSPVHLSPPHSLPSMKRRRRRRRRRRRWWEVWGEVVSVPSPAAQLVLWLRRPTDQTLGEGRRVGRGEGEGRRGRGKRRGERGGEGEQGAMEQGGRGEGR